MYFIYDSSYVKPKFDYWYELDIDKIYSIYKELLHKTYT